MKKNNYKVVFIGGLTNGNIILNFIRKQKISIPLIFTYPKKFKKKPRFININKKKFPNSKIINDTNINKYLISIKNIKPDIIIVAGWSYMISQKILNLPKNGSIGFHPSKRPLDRGRSVLAWQIEEGYNKTALSMFYMSKKPDAGDIIDQRKILISKKDYIKNILDKVDIATLFLIRKNLFKVLKKRVKGIKQNDKYSNYRKIRNLSNQVIDWNDKFNKIFNKVRAISKPYPGAIGFIGGKPLKIWSIKIAKSKIRNSKYLYIRCKDKLIAITNYDKI